MINDIYDIKYLPLKLYLLNRGFIYPFSSNKNVVRADFFRVYVMYHRLKIAWRARLQTLKAKIEEIGEIIGNNIVLGWKVGDLYIFFSLLKKW